MNFLYSKSGKFFAGAILLFLMSFQLAQAQLTATITNKKDDCADPNNGSFDVTIDMPGTTGPYSVFVLGLSFGQVGAGGSASAGVAIPITGLRPDTYLVNVSDSDGGTPNYNTFVTINAVTAPVVGFSGGSPQDNANCNSPNGQIRIDVSGGSGTGFTYSWTGPGGFTATTEDINGLAGGSYTVVVSDNGTVCTTTFGPVTIADPSPIVYNVSTTTPLLCGGNDGNVSLSFSEGAAVTYEIFKDGVATGITQVGTGAALSFVIPAVQLTAPGTYAFTIRATRGLCTPAFMNGTANIQVDSNVTPSVSIAANPGTTICAGTSVTFTATPTNGGTTPSYQWKKNGINVGSNSSQYTDAGLVNTDVIEVEMTSNATCLITPTATSNQLTMTVTPNVTPSVSIAANPGTTICAGTSVTFTATPTNGGASPSYQWIKNGINVGSNSNQYTDGGLVNGDVVDVVLTSNAACLVTPTANSNQLTMVVNPNLTPSVSIAANPGTSICAGTSVTFTATPTNGGASPSYQWRKNGVNVGSNSNQYTDAGLVNNDVVDVVMTSNATCLTTPTANSNQLTMTVTPTVTPSVSIAANPGISICAGTSVTFTATPTNGGASPSYQWKKNGVNVGSNSNQYTDAGLVNSDVIEVEMTSNAVCPSPAIVTSNQLTMTVTPTVTPSVSISANPGTTICAGTSVTFTAVPTNGGASPSYQWRKNGVNVGSNSNQYTDAGLVNSDVVDVVMTSNAACLVTPTANSNQLTMVVNPNLTPSVSIAANPGTSICAGTSVTFTATPTNGGASPSYQWRKNGVNVGSNSNQYTDAALVNSDVIDVVMTSNATCLTTPTANSNQLTMTVTANVTPSVSIAANPGISICAGTSVTFTATPTNGGASPSYQWRKNGVNVGSNSNQYTDAGLVNNDVVDVVMTSNATCLTTPTANSNQLTMTVTANVTPSVSIAANPGTSICAGTSVTFTATPTNGGASPSYQWRKNGVNVGSNSNQYTDAGLVNNDVVDVVMTSNATCLTTPTANSNQLTMTVTPTVTPSVSISANPGTTICTGTSVTFTATPTNGGASPSYQWRKNGVNVGSNSNQYTDAGLVNNDVVDVVMTSNATCLTTPTATSNQLTITITPSLVPSVSISANPGTTICTGTSVTFTATPTNGGATPSYQWRKNGVNVGSNSNQYTDVGLVDSDVIDVVMTTSETCVTTTTANSNQLTITITTSLVPSVSISANPGTSICAGTSVTFTATPTNGGASPSYQWKRNGVNVGSNSNQYTDAGLANNDVIEVEMTSNATCVTTPSATSNQLTMTVTPTVTPSVSIAANPGTTICEGTSVTFTATPTNGGASPSYQWRKNGVNVGSNSNQYTDAGLVNGDVVDVVMTSNAACLTTPTANSNQLTMTVTSNVTPSVSISANPGTTICSSTSVTFTATPTNGGASPSYQWKKNGVNVGSNSNQYTDAGLANNDVIEVEMTSNATCLTTPTATSNQLTMTVTPSVTPSVSIAANPGTTICAGTSVTFTATPTNGGASPSYQWKKNGVNVGSNSDQYTDAGLANNDVIEVEMTSNATCLTTPTATSNQLTMTVTPSVTPTVSIAANPGVSICAGTSVTFTATPTNGGTSPSYQWKKNGVNVGTDSDQYTDAGLVDGDILEVELTSNEVCVTTAVATSNQLTMVVSANLTPSVVIVSDAGTSICVGDNVTFTATPTNGGTTPSYQWKKNGTNVGIDSDTYSDNTLADGDQISVELTSNETCLTTPTATSNTLTISVVTSIVPTVSISSDLGTTVCQGATVTFTATPTGGGPTPGYQWKKNGADVGTDSDTYADATLVDGDVIEVVLTSSASCASTPTANSNQLTITVTPSVTPSVDITGVNPGTTNCQGASVTFTATPTNGGATPSYQWKKNGINVGTDSDTYTDNTLADGDQITVELTSSITCSNPTVVVSSAVTMDVTPNVTPSVTILADAGPTICVSENVTFTATPTNEGAAPSYQWKKNGVNVGTNSNQYSDAGLADGDIIEVELTSNETCITSATASSNQLTMDVVNSLTPTVSISANPGTTICAGTSVTFSATTSGGGTTPTYQWKKDGINVGTNSSTYTDATLVNGNAITLEFTSSSTCATIPTVTSNTLTISIDPINCPTGNCATVVIEPQPSPATCTLSNGSVYFNINPAVPSINNTGVKIDIVGPVSRTNFNQFNFTGLPAGSYTFTVEYGDPSCIKTGSFDIDKSGTVGDPIVSNPVSTNCFGSSTGAVTIDVLGETGNPLQWSITPGDASSWVTFTSGQPDGVQGLPAGNLVISIRRTSADPCYSAAFVTITEGSTQILTDFSVTDATCGNDDGVITIVSGPTGGSGGYSFKVDGVDRAPVSNAFSNLSGGNHVISVTDNAGCQRDFNVVIPFPGIINTSSLSSLDASCGEGGLIVFLINNPGNTTYTIGYTTDFFNEPTNYSSAFYTPPADPSDPNAVGTVQIEDLPRGNYYVWVRSSTSQCPTRLNSTTIDIGGPYEVSFNFGCRTDSDDPGADDIQLINISGAPGLDYNYEVVGDGFSASGSFTPTVFNTYTIVGEFTGAYVVKITQNQLSVGGCIDEGTDYQVAPIAQLDFVFIETPEPKAKYELSLPETGTASRVVRIQRSGSVLHEISLKSDPADEDNWIEIDREYRFYNLAVGEYILSVRDAYGCIRTTTFTVGLDDSIVIPNIFTPDNNGLNDTFFIRNLPPEGSKLIITNRWGKQVYSSGNYKSVLSDAGPTGDWDGEGVADGIYFYRLQVEGGKVFTGWVEILRGAK
jgi:hypothetical protein